MDILGGRVRLSGSGVSEQRHYVGCAPGCLPLWEEFQPPAPLKPSAVSGNLQVAGPGLTDRLPARRKHEGCRIRA